MTLLAVLQTVGILLSGIAAIVSVTVRRHVGELRKEVNGQTTTLVATAHKLGVAEGVLSEVRPDADAHEAAPA